MNILEKVKNFYEEIVSENRLNEIKEYVSDKCELVIGDKKILIGINGMEQHLIAVRNTYPDLKMKIIRQYHDNGTVISEFIMGGTHLNEWLGMKPTGKKLRITGVNIDKVDDGKIIEHGGAANTFEALFDAGIIKPA